MTEQGETGSRIDEYIAELRKKAESSRAAAEDFERQVEFLIKEKELLGKYGQIPLAMQTTQFIVEQIAATDHEDERAPIETPPSGRSDEVNLGGAVRILRPRRRRATPIEGGGAGDGKKYSIAPQVKHIMRAIFGSGQEEVPETLESLFDKIYPGQDWHSKTITVPKGIRRGHQQVTYADDLKSDHSFIKRLIRGADGVINTKMRVNNDSSFAFAGKTATPELIQLYRTIESVGWEVYDGFMIRNKIREPLNQL